MSLRWVEELDAQRGYEFEGEYHGRHYMTTPEGRLQAEEARLAFVEKRKPNFGVQTESPYPVSHLGKEPS
jgi:hypothetical protein